jgi:hypothetical protein
VLAHWRKYFFGVEDNYVDQAFQPDFSALSGWTARLISVPG